jgi:hypothetical protein
MDQRGEIVILEDNPDRRDAMAARLQDRYPQYTRFFFHEPAKLIEHLSRALSQALVISLDHDLDLIPRSDGSLFDPGTGMMVVDWLATQPPVCPVIVHTTNLPAAKLMKRRLQSAGWQAQRITPYDDLAWINAEWFTGLRDLLLKSDAAPERTSQPEVSRVP